MSRTSASKQRRSPGPRGRGFTLLELVIAVTILASFVLPLMMILSDSKIRAIRYTQKRQLRDLAQRKLFERMYYDEQYDEGTFELEGRPEWRWEVLPPEMVGQGEQPLLQYTIRIWTPQKVEDEGGGSVGSSAPLGGFSTSSFMSLEEGSVFELSMWTFPDAEWIDMQRELYDSGQYSELYGDPDY